MARSSINWTANLLRAAVLTIVLASATACGSDAESSDTDGQVDAGAEPVAIDDGTDDASAGDSGADSGGAAAGDDPLADAPALQPSNVLEVDVSGNIDSVAVSPDGARVAVTSQDGLGTPVTIGLYDAQTGQELASTEVEVISMGRLHWMADGRLVAAAEGSIDAQWLSWDGSTLASLQTLPLDRSCGDGRVDKKTGAVYSSDGLTSMNDTLCRFDTADGAIVRTADGVLVGAERFWVLPGTARVTVLHAPDPDVASELITLDGATLTPQDTTVVEFTDAVREVGATAWIQATFEDNTRLEPGAIPAPPVDPRRVSGAGTIFVALSDSGDVVFVSSTDATVLGTIPEGMNLAFSDWSLDDSVFARLATETQVEIYNLTP